MRGAVLKLIVCCQEQLQELMYTIESLIDIARVRTIMEKFYALTGIPFVLLRPDGTFLIDIGGHPVCRDFHRSSEVSGHICAQSDLDHIQESMESGDSYHIYTCPFGLTEVVCPVKAEGNVYALLCAGQFYSDDAETVSPEQLAERAKQYGYDAEAYRRAAESVPVRSREEIQHAADFMREEVKLISENAARKLKYLEQAGKLEQASSENIQAQSDLENQKQLLQTIIDTLPAGIFWKDKHAVYIGCNRQFALDSGVHGDIEQIKGKTDKDLPTVRMDYRYFHEIDRQVIEEGKSLRNMEHKIVKDDGPPFWTYTSKVPLCSEDGAITGLVGVYIDITKLKETEIRLHKQEEQLRTIIQHSSDPIWIIDLDLNFVFASPSISRLIGYSAEEMQDIPLDDVIPPESLAEFRKMIQEKRDIFQQPVQEPLNESVRMHIDYVHREGYIVHAEVNTSPLTDMNGKLYGILGVTRDITEQVKFSEKLRQSQKMEALGRLAGGIAHDFNNLLHIILGYSEMIQMMSEGSEVRDLAEPILDAGRKAQNLIEHLLLFSRGDQQGREYTDVRKMLTDFTPMLQRLIGEHIPVHTRIEQMPVKVKIHMQQFQQVLVNLILNAKEAMPNGGEIDIIADTVSYDEPYHGELTVIEPGSYARIMMADTGTGIEKDEAGKIFEPFYSTKEHVSGGGLGLSAVYAIVKQHQGFIDVHSMIGVGTTFEILLPMEKVQTDEKRKLDIENSEISDAEPKVSADENIPPGGTGREKKVVLFAEDNDMIRNMTRMSLQKHGYEVLTAENGDAAVQLFMKERERIDCLVLDVVMPGRSGKEVYDYAAAMNPDIKAVFCTGYDDNILSPRFLSSTDAEFVQKPYSIETLVQAVENQCLNGKRENGDDHRSGNRGSGRNRGGGGSSGR